MSATLYLFVGYPGSGKTTAANIICKLTGAEHIWADRERQKMFGRPTHSPQESAALYHRLNERTRQLLLQDKSVVFDTNFNYRRDRDHLRGLLEPESPSLLSLFSAASAALVVGTSSWPSRTRTLPNASPSCAANTAIWAGCWPSSA